MVGTLKPGEAEARSEGVARWKLAVGAVFIVVILVTATLLLRAHGYIGGGSPSTAAQTDLCQAGSTNNCQGWEITIPYLENDRESNVSLCDSIVPTSSGQSLVLRYATSTYMYGVLVPSVIYWGTNVSFSENPAGFLNDPAAVSQSAWSSGSVTGDHSIDAVIPADYPEWCLAWYNPGPYGLVSFASDAYLTS
jgi:hypothetical protein